MYKWIDINTPDDLDQLTQLLLDDYNPQEVVDELKGQLSSEVKGILIEEGYVDKDYRSTYYDFYAKKGLRYSAFCVRLHFFKEGVKLAADRDLLTDSPRLQDRYIGYMVLRPTPITPIGRTVLAIHAKNNVEGAIIETDHHVHVLGYRIEVAGFPYMQQPTDIAVCAHAACWSILRHYSQRHRTYAEFTLADITHMASLVNAGGLIPSRGFDVDAACRVFSQAGLYPDIYDGKEFPGRIHRLLNAYVESGFPVFGVMGMARHAITVIGHGKPDRTAFDGVPDQQLYSWDAINSFVVIDDNHMPYLTIDCLDGGPYKLTEIDTFVVPLPEKIYFPAEAVEDQVEKILTDGFPDLDLTFMPRPVTRYFITSAGGFREYVRNQKSALPPNLFRLLMDLSLPQFIWLVQIADVEDWKKQRCNVMMIIDATASALDEEPFFVLHDRDRAFVYDRGDSKDKGYIEFGDSKLAYVSEFRRNLSYRH